MLISNPPAQPNAAQGVNFFVGCVYSVSYAIANQIDNPLTACWNTITLISDLNLSQIVRGTNSTDRIGQSIAFRGFQLKFQMAHNYSDYAVIPEGLIPPPLEGNNRIIGTPVNPKYRLVIYAV